MANVGNMPAFAIVFLNCTVEQRHLFVKVDCHGKTTQGNSRDTFLAFRGIMKELIGILVLLFILLVAIIILKCKPKTFGEFLAALFEVIGSDKQRTSTRQDAADEYPYYSREQLLSQRELAFYQVLKQAVGDQYTIAMKVRLADLITCQRSQWNKGYGSKITHKHVDFVLIDPNDSGIKRVIELNDKSHKKARRRERDQFKANALKAAEIHFVAIKAAARYDTGSLRSEVTLQ